MKFRFTKLNVGLLFVGALFFMAACKKTVTPDPIVNPPTSTRAELTKDSIYLYAQQTYFWNAGMPTYSAFNPRKYSTNQDVLNAIKELPSTGKPTDKYSFIDDGSTASTLSGVGGDFGFSVFFNAATDLRVKYVYANSPASNLNLKRGDRILSFNGRTDVSANSQSFIDALNNGLFGNGTTITMNIQKANGSTASVVVNRGPFTINPIIYSNIYTVGTKKVGYIVYNSFTTNSTAGLDAVFALFAAQDVTEVILDLRYNGGGSVGTAVNLTNLIAPSSQNGKTMFTTYFNTTMQSGQATILQNQKFWGEGNDGVTRLYSYFDFNYAPTKAAGNLDEFQKRGSANKITRAYFLVTGATASASELVINNLKPVMDVKVIGRTTYGKPVGFFAIRIDESDLYIPQFQTRNQVNFGDYFNGFVPDVTIADDVTKEFGDVSERYLAYALNYAEKGNFNLSVSRLNLLSSVNPLPVSTEARLTDELTKNEFKGMVDDRPRFRLNK